MEALGWERWVLTVRGRAARSSPSCGFHALVVNPGAHRARVPRTGRRGAARSRAARRERARPRSPTASARCAPAPTTGSTKPCHPEELIARIQAVLRRRRAGRRAARRRGRSSPARSRSAPTASTRTPASRRASLSRREFELLAELAAADGRVLEREEIYSRVWGYTMARGDRSVDVFVRKVRQKLERISPAVALRAHPFRRRLPVRRRADRCRPAGRPALPSTPRAPSPALRSVRRESHDARTLRNILIIAAIAALVVIVPGGGPVPASRSRSFARVPGRDRLGGDAHVSPAPGRPVLAGRQPARRSCTARSAWRADAHRDQPAVGRPPAARSPGSCCSSPRCMPPLRWCTPPGGTDRGPARPRRGGLRPRRRRAACCCRCF